MSDTTVASVRRIVAGAAHGAWMGLLVGVLVLLLSWAAFMAMCAFAPDLISFLMDTPLQAARALALHWYAAMKLLLIGWLLFASFLSCWWKAL